MLIRSAGNRDWRLFFMPDLQVSVNGEVVHDIVEADDVAGYVVRYFRDAAGKLVEDGNRYKSERVEGAVVFNGTKRWSQDDARAAAQAKRDRKQIRNIAMASRNAAEGGAA